MRTRLPLVLLLANLTASGALAQVVPKTVTFPVVSAPGQPAPDGAAWRTWSLSNPSATMAIGKPGNTRVGDLRPGTAFIDADVSTALPFADERVAAIEQSVPDLDSPGGLAGVIGVARFAHAASFRALPAMSLVSLEAPSVDGPTQRVTVAPLLTAAGPLDDADGLAGFAVERCDASLASCVEIGRLVASAAPASIVDSAPAGTWRYVVRAVFSGDVLGRDPSPASASITVVGSTCDEPSALDRAPLAQPLLVAKTGATLHLAWEALGSQWDVARVALPARVLAPEIVACQLTSPSLDRDEPWGVAGYLVATHCGATRSSFGRDSSGDERPGAADCP